jgi:hypothetical protein
VTVFHFRRLTSVNWCGKVTINGNMYRDQVSLSMAAFMGALLYTKPESMRNLRVYFFPQYNIPYFIAESWKC